MAAKTSPLLLHAVVLLVLSTATTEAFNIRRLLDRFPEFSTFNGYLAQTELYRDINHMRTITVLAVDNTAIGGISGRPLDDIKRIMSNHVTLDYFNQVKLDGIKKRSTILTTLFQASRVAQEMHGFLNVTKSSEGKILFGLAMKGVSPDAELVKAVAAQPYIISVLQISRLIIAPGIDMTNPNLTRAATPLPAKAPAAAKLPAEAPVAEALAKEDPFMAPVGSPVDTPADIPVSCTSQVYSTARSRYPTIFGCPSIYKHGSCRRDGIYFVVLLRIINVLWLYQVIS